MSFRNYRSVKDKKLSLSVPRTNTFINPCLFLHVDTHKDAAAFHLIGRIECSTGQGTNDIRDILIISFCSALRFSRAIISSVNPWSR